MLNHILFSTGSDNFVEGIGIAVAGLLIVFIVLILICGILYLFGHLFYKKPEAVVSVAEKPVEEAPQAAEEIAQETDEAELVAAITAAISCCLGRSADGFVVRSFKRIGRKRGR